MWSSRKSVGDLLPCSYMQSTSRQETSNAGREQEMTLDANDIISIKELIVDPLSKKIDEIHTPEKCPAILAVRQDIVTIHKSLEEVKGHQKFFFGGFTVFIFIITFFKESIVGIFRR